jgi:hypothetical protein
MQTVRADERHGLGFLLQDEHLHIVQPQFGGQHRPGRPAAGNDHIEDHAVQRPLGGERRVLGRGHGQPQATIRIIIASKPFRAETAGWADRAVT